MLAAVAAGRWATATQPYDACVTETTTVIPAGQITDTACVAPLAFSNVIHTDPVEPALNPPSDCACGSRLLLDRGRLSLDATDLEVPSRGFNFTFSRNYRSDVIHKGPLGNNWDHAYFRRLMEDLDNNIILIDGMGRSDLYELQPDTSYTAPPGFYTRLTKNLNGSFTERESAGAIVEYAALDAVGVARMTRLSDRDGNAMQFLHNGSGQLTQVIDTMGRPIDYSYDGQGRLTTVTDFTGRSVSFSYDSYGELADVTSPAVTGTPSGNDFSAGKTTRYEYLTATGDPRLEHNLVSVTAPNEVVSSGLPRLSFEYDTSPASPNFDRVLEQTEGGTNSSSVPAGGTTTYSYQVLDASPPSPVTSVYSRTLVTDRNGNDMEYEFNLLGNIITTRRFTNQDIRATAPPYFEARYEYNDDSQLLRVISAEGNVSENTYEDGDIGGGQFDRLQQGNPLASVLTPDAVRDGDQTSIKTATTYEPIYNQVRTTVDPRGNDPTYVPQNGGVTSPARYTTTYTYDYEEDCDFAAIGARIGRTAEEVQQQLNDAGMCALPLGDVNGDGIVNQVLGNAIRTRSPNVNLLAGSNQAAIEGDTIQEIVQTSTYNQFGQLIRSTDPEDNVDTYEYYPERDPNGDGVIDNPVGNPLTGGYLKQATGDKLSGPGRNSGTDPNPAIIRTVYEYDARGNMTRQVDGRGIATDYVYNQLNQAVETRRAAAHAVYAPDPPEPLALTDFLFLERTFYDANDNVIHRQVEDRGNTSGAGADNTGTAFIDSFYVYDVLDRQVDTIDEVSDSEDLTTRYRYDPNGNPVLTIAPEGNATSSVYDERDLVFQSTAGATAPPPLVLLRPGDPINYNVRGGLPSTMTYHYDLNGNLAETVDGEDTDGLPSNNSDLAGSGDRMRYIYDGFDRQTSAVDSVGNQSVTQYDPAGNVFRTTRFGPVGGPSPVSDGPDTLLRPVSSAGVIQAANLVSANLMEASEARYDELARAFQSDAALFVNTIPTLRPPGVDDGATSLGKGNLTPGDTCAVPGVAGPAYLGCVTTRTEYDRSSRATFSVEDDADTSRTFYDGAGRVIKSLDPEGNIIESAYDDNSNVIETRQTDKSQVGGVPDEIFLTTTFYDSLDRVQRSIDNVGQTYDYRYDSRDNLAAQADASGPSGAAIARRAFTGGALTVNTTNLVGNVAVYFYDGLSRQVRQDSVLTASGQGDGVNIGADVFGVKNATPPPDTSQSADGLITATYDYDGNSLQASLTDDLGNQATYEYDNLDRKVSETKGLCVPPALANSCDPPTTTVYEYDRDHNIERTTDENGSITDCLFDAVNRGISCLITRAAGVGGTTTTTYEYDALGRVVRSTDNNEPAIGADDSLVTLAYDSLSRLIEETQKIGGLAAKAIDSAWRAAGLRSGLTYPQSGVFSRTTVYEYDANDRIIKIKDGGAIPYITEYDYIGDRELQRSYPINGTRQTRLDDAGTADAGYDGVMRTTQLRHLRADNSVIAGFSHAYDRASNKLGETKLHNATNNETYDYDAAYRLTDFDRPNGVAITPLHSDWTLDGAGNWQQVDAETRQHSSFNEITDRNGTPVLSDDNGNETDDGTYLFTWDYANHLRTVTRKSDSALVATYSYDAAGRRTRKVVTNSGALNGTTDFYLDGAQEIEERNGADALTQQYVYGNYIDEPLVLDRNLNTAGIEADSATGAGDQRLFYHQNTLSSNFALTDASGVIQEGYQYDAYGRQTVFTPGGDGDVDWGGDDVVTPGGVSTDANPFLFTGRRLDPETGLYYYRARYLNTGQGRFISRDPIEFAAADSDLYSYVRGEPLAYADPSGYGSKKGKAIASPPPAPAANAAGPPPPQPAIPPFDPQLADLNRMRLRVWIGVEAQDIAPNPAAATAADREGTMARERNFHRAQGYQTHTLAGQWVPPGPAVRANPNVGPGGMLWVPPVIPGQPVGGRPAVPHDWNDTFAALLVPPRNPRNTCIEDMVISGHGGATETSLFPSLQTTTFCPDCTLHLAICPGAATPNNAQLIANATGCVVKHPKGAICGAEKRTYGATCYPANWQRLPVTQTVSPWKFWKLSETRETIGWNVVNPRTGRVYSVEGSVRP